MSTLVNFGTLRERPRPPWYIKLLQNLRSQMTLWDLFVGSVATLLISSVLIGFRYQIIPEYKAGQIADSEIRAGQDVLYEDTNATNLRRAEEAAGVAALYRLDSDLISDREKTISWAFSQSRNLLAQRGVTAQTKLNPLLERELLNALQNQVGQVFPSRVLPVLLNQRFAPVLEGRILKILDTVLRDGIIQDRGQFLRDQRAGMLIRDSSSLFERPPTDAYLARDVYGAREYLRQFRLDLSELPQPQQAILIQYLETELFPTLVFDRQETESRRAAAAARVQPVQIQIKQGQTIVHSGEKITPGMVLQLDALRNLRRPRSLIWQFGGYFLFTAILVYSLWRYFVFYQHRHRKIRNHTVLILTIILLELLTIRLATALADILGERFQRFHDPSVLYYGIPFAFGALLATLLVDVNLGIICTIALGVLAGLFYGDADITAYLIVGSLAAIYSVRQYKDRAAILKSGVTIGIINVLCLTGLDLLHQTPFKISDALNQLIAALASGILASAVASILLPALEYLFKIATDIRLLELSNLNAPMLRRLSVGAPGTYHHSLMMATLAETAAESIGANALLVRVAAYYHDVGKVLRPEYFVENQSYGSNKHEELSPGKSFSIISSHVKDGLQLAKEIGLPQRISDMIPQHHGTRVMAYFYEKARNSSDASETGVLESSFRYTGPKPQSKEAAIIMMADAVEAASRTLSDPIPAQLNSMIDQLVDAIVSENQLDECDITLRDVQLVKKSFLKILNGIFHHRIDYPGYDFRLNGEDSRKNSVSHPGPEPAKAI
jgi:putative nucleotidyltransferase with HDIG domain